MALNRNHNDVLRSCLEAVTNRDGFPTARILRSDKQQFARKVLAYVSYCLLFNHTFLVGQSCYKFSPEVRVAALQDCPLSTYAVFQSLTGIGKLENRWRIWLERLSQEKFL